MYFQQNTVKLEFEIFWEGSIVNTTILVLYILETVLTLWRYGFSKYTFLGTSDYMFPLTVYREAFLRPKLTSVVVPNRRRRYIGQVNGKFAHFQIFNHSLPENKVQEYLLLKKMFLQWFWKCVFIVAWNIYIISRCLTSKRNG